MERESARDRERRKRETEQGQGQGQGPRKSPCPVCASTLEALEKESETFGCRLNPNHGVSQSSYTLDIENSTSCTCVALLVVVALVKTLAYPGVRHAFRQKNHTDAAAASWSLADTLDKTHEGWNK